MSQKRNMRIAPKLDYVDYVIEMKYENSAQFRLCRLCNRNEI